MAFPNGEGARCGSYPFMNIAQDFNLPYGVVLRFAQSFAGEYPAITLEDETYLQVVINRTDFKNRIMEALNATRNQ